MRIGSLFTGYGGLDIAAEQVTSGHTVWVCDPGPGPALILAHRYPDVPNLGDLTAVDWGAVEPVDVLTGGSPCFAVGTPVLTRRGIVPIEHVTTADEVWTHRARWRRVTATMQREADALVEFRSGFFSTPEHLLWLRRPISKWDNSARRYRRLLTEPVWTPAADSAGTFAATPVRVQASPAGKPERLTWWQIGRYLADGFTNHQVNVYVGRPKEGDIERFPGWKRSDQTTAIRLTLPGSASERDWLDAHFGKRAEGKTIPAFVLALPDEDRRAVLEGYWSGDGYRFSATATRSNSVSPCLTVGIELLAASCGFTTSVHCNMTAPTTVIEGRTVRQRPWWSVTATRDDGRFTKRDAQFMWSKLRKVPPRHPGATVYDLTVDDDQSFVAAGIVVHNCQDMSFAGRRQGLRSGTRSGLWSYMADAVAALRPALVIWENVHGALSAPAASAGDLEPDPGGLGGAIRRPALRAAGRVVGDLAGLGYDAAWRCLTAADVGAPHRRERVFLLAWPANGAQAVAADSAGDGRQRGGAAWERRGGPADHGAGPVALLPTPQAADHRASATAPSVARHVTAGMGSRAEVIGHTDWGRYAPAITRWELVLGRPAPDPTEPGTSGRRLSARFVEWMMGLPDGWVTDVPRLSRVRQLEALGNGVVPQQAATAIRYLLDVRRNAWAAVA